MLNIQNLSAGYTPQAMILHNFSLQLTAGERIGIIGQNGSGKSTLAKAIMGMVPYHSGAVYWNDKDLLSEATHRRNQEGIAYFMQGGKVFGNLTVAENLKIAGVKHAKKNTLKVLQNGDITIPLVGNQQRLGMLAANLSGGERHILSLLMVLQSCPNMKLLIADEPSAGVSQKNQNDLLQLMKQVLLHTQSALLLIEQNKDFLKELTTVNIQLNTN